MSERIAAAAVLVVLFAACALSPAPALAADKEVQVVVDSDDDSSAWLGVSIMELDDELRDDLDIGDDIDGIVVTDVYDGSPAEEAGLEEDDVIISVNGEKGKDLSHFVDLVRSKKPGDEVELRIYRDGEMKTVKATLAEHEGIYVVKKDGLDLESLGNLEALAALGNIIIPDIDLGTSSWGRRGRLGVYIDDVSGDLADYFEVPGGEGVLVEQVVEDSPAEKAGIKAGDIIYKIGDTTICCTDELVKAIGKMESDRETPIVLIRKGKQMTVKAVVEESEYDKALQAYKVHIGDLADKDIFIKSLESKELSDEERAELKEEVKQLKKELKELREELKQLATERD
jgi:serine protease Do